MTATGGWKGKITINDGSEKEILGATSYELTINRDMIDVTTYELASEHIARARLAGLKDATLSISGVVDSTNDTGFLAIRLEALADAETIRAYKAYYEGETAGLTMYGIVSSLKYTPPVDGVTSFTAEVQMAYDGTNDPITTF